MICQLYTARTKQYLELCGQLTKGNISGWLMMLLHILTHKD
jgi:hypothetical protein